MNTFNEAIDTAKAARSSTSYMEVNNAIATANAPGGDIDSAYLDLIQALNAFYGAKQSGDLRSFNPVNPTTLTENTWTNGNIPSSSGVQWFKFTATANTQYIHISFGTLNDLYVQVYNSSGVAVGSQTNIYGDTTYVSRAVTVGQTYYIRVQPYSYTTSGTYKIAFNASETAP